MKLTIIMSVLNGEKFLHDVIESILSQTYNSFEFLIIDDGSTDESFKIIKNYSEKDNRIKIIVNPYTLGLTKSLNKGISVAKGEFIARQDVDDISLSNRLEKQLEFLIKNPKHAFCGCNGFKKQKNQETIKFYNEDDIYKNLIAENCFVHPSIIIRKEILEKYGYYDERFYYGQDYELWCRLIYKYKLRAKNLSENLMIINAPGSKNLNKFFIQRLNNIRTKLMYLKYTEYKCKGIFSIFIKLMEIFTLSYIMGYFTKFFKKIEC